MKILAVSDRVDPYLETGVGTESARDADLIVSCGDLPFEYLERLVTLLNVPMLFVLGNHDRPLLRHTGRISAKPEGGTDLDGRVKVVRCNRGDVLIAAGLQGTHMCEGPGSGITELGMARRLIGMLPRLLWNRIRYGRSMDLLVSHAPPAGIHEGQDPCHRGFRVLRWAIRLFRPAVAVHGHVHPTYGVDVRPARLGTTRVLSIFGSQRLEVDDARR